MIRIILSSIDINNIIISNSDLDYITQWISKSGELSYISGEKGPLLTKSILKSWLYNKTDQVEKIFAVVFLKNSHDKIVGLCTLTRAEEPVLDTNDVEICHLIIHKKYRREYYASSIIKLLIKQAFKNNFSRVLGRVHIHNYVGSMLLSHLGWKKSDFSNRDTDVVWYEYSLK